MTNSDTADRAALPEAALACQRRTADEDIEVVGIDLLRELRDTEGDENRGNEVEVRAGHSEKLRVEG